MAALPSLTSLFAFSVSSVLVLARQNHADEQESSEQRAQEIDVLFHELLHSV